MNTIRSGALATATVAATVAAVQASAQPTVVETRTASMPPHYLHE